MSSSRTERGQLFYKIHSAMRNYIKLYLEDLKSWADYYKIIYSWYDEFLNDILILEKKNKAIYKEYLKNLNYGGLLKIDSNKIISDSYKYSVPIKKVGNRNEIMNLKNNKENIKKAGRYLKENFYYRFYEKIDHEKLSKNCEQSVNNIIMNICNEGMKIIKGEHPDDVINLNRFADKHKINAFEKWGMIIIYAHIQESPIEYTNKKFPSPNIYMASKGEIQNLSHLEDRCGGASRVLIINYAGTSFLAAERITNEVKNSWNVFLYNLLEGKTKIDVVLTNPDSAAAKDAERYKIRPYTVKIPIEKIIPDNIQDLKNTMKKYSNSDIHLYFTDIALPCAYLKAEFKDNPEKDNIKIDIYLPTFAEYCPNATPKNECDNELRQSFIIFREDNPELYNVFSNNMERILEHSVKCKEEEL